ncbi:MAG TPA: 30S ribosomal protein S9 [Longimicrobiales bacterium]|nr:30S ribosomal protein S9 [Longimicrobiales bacterium]
MANEQYHGLGRRKSSVARVWLRPGNGEWKVNGRGLDDYFPRGSHQTHAEEPLVATAMKGRFDITVTVAGGGQTGQAGAVRLGVARALIAFDAELRSALREKRMLTRDPREVERKKPGRPGARKRFQFSKR